MFNKLVIYFLLSWMFHRNLGLTIKRSVDKPVESLDIYQRSKAILAQEQKRTAAAADADAVDCSSEVKNRDKRNAAEKISEIIITNGINPDQQANKEFKINGVHMVAAKKDTDSEKKTENKNERAKEDKGSKDVKIVAKDKEPVADELTKNQAPTKDEKEQDDTDETHYHTREGGDTGTANIKSDTKLDVKKVKPDLDIFLYGNMSPLHKLPPFYEIFNSKEELSPYEHVYPPYKRMQHSPIQSAFEIANMLLKVGLDELDSDDYNELPFLESSGKLNHRSLEKVSSFCPVHALQKSSDSNGLGQKVVQVCSCHLIKKNPEEDHGHFDLNKIEGMRKRDFFEDISH